MFKLFKGLVLVTSLFLTGCGGGCEKAKNAVGISEDAETLKQRAEEKKKELEEQKKKELEEKKLKEQQLKDADALVHSTAESLAAKADGGFPRHEGLTELDPWGNQLKIDYRQEWFEEIMVVRSAGPDGKFNTADDLTRTRKTSHASGILQGISTFGWIAIIWVLTGVLAFLLSAGVGRNRRAHGKSSRHKSPVGFIVATILLAPLVFIVYGIQFIGGIFGATGDFFDGFDFD